jgi:4-amino-4-deoxy-L-arabinose transferase-like glycosyltransferase
VIAVTSRRSHAITYLVIAVTSRRSHAITYLVSSGSETLRGRVGTGMSGSATRVPRRLTRALAALRARPEVVAIVALAGALNLWDLSRNGWANTFYTGAVRSMAGSWHDFLYASLDHAGLMTVDKTPAALWVQALSVRIFGFSSWSLLVPEAVMGIIAALLVYDLVRGRFGRLAGTAAAVTLALTPITVAMSRHNNPDELLILSCVAALWCADRGLRNGRLRWLLMSGLCIGVGFETKMSVALFVVPGIALAWLWVEPARRGRVRAFGQLLAGGGVLAVVGLAWPVLVWLTPAADRPWISGTSDNSIWSLIVNYNGVGRVTGQAGSPTAIGGGGSFGGGGGGGVGGGGGGASAGATGPLRLLDSALGGQAGWLLGAALVAGLALVVVTRLRRDDPRTPFILIAGGAFLVSAVVFSVASGIFHPYYVSFLAPWSALLVGAGVGEALAPGRRGQIIAPLLIAGGAITELVVVHNISDEGVGWAPVLVLAVAAPAAVVLALPLQARARAVIVAVALAVLLAAPAAWAVDTLGHATSSTFPAGGPEESAFGGGGGFPGAGGRTGGFPGRGSSGAPNGAPSTSGSSSSGSGSVSGLFGGGTSRSGASSAGRGSFFHGGSFSRGGSFGGAGGTGGFGNDSDTELLAAAKYARAHGGGTVAVESQGEAADAIIAGDNDVAGIGGFSGLESTVSAQWLAMEVRDGKLRWILSEATTGAPGADGRTGSEKAVAIAEQAGRKVTFTSGGQTITLYDLKGRAAQILAAAR